MEEKKNDDILGRLAKIEDALAVIMTEREMAKEKKSEEKEPSSVREAFDMLLNYVYATKPELKDDEHMPDFAADVYNRLSDAEHSAQEALDAVENYRDELAEADMHYGKLTEHAKSLEAENAELKKKLESAAGNARLYKVETDSAKINYERLREELEKIRGIVMPHRNQIRFAARIGVPRVLERDTLHLLEGILGDVVAVMEA